MMPWGGMMGWGGGGLGMAFGVLFMLVFWGLILAAAVLVVRWLWEQGRSTPRRGTTGSALEILKERYARGEIDRDEFEVKKRDLLA